MQNRDLRVYILFLVQVSRRCASETRRAGPAGAGETTMCAWHCHVLICVFSFNSPSNVSVRPSRSSHGIYFIAPSQLLKIKLIPWTSSMANPRLE